MKILKIDFGFLGIAGLALLATAILPGFDSFGEKQTMLKIGWPASVVGIPVVLAALLGVLDGQAILRHMFPGLIPRGIAGVLTGGALLSHVGVLRAYSDGGVNPAMGYWIMWLLLGALGFLLVNPSTVSFFNEANGPYSGVVVGDWVATPFGTVTLEGELMPHDQWFQVSQIVGRRVSMLSSDGRLFVVFDRDNLIKHQGEGEG
jgi:hypothetical protein